MSKDILVAFAPLKPLPPTVSKDGSNKIVISWVEPNIQGSAITSYEIMILNMLTNTYVVNTTICDGT